MNRKYFTNEGWGRLVVNEHFFVKSLWNFAKNVTSAAGGSQQGGGCSCVHLGTVLAENGGHELLLAALVHLVEALLASLLTKPK